MGGPRRHAEVARGRAGRQARRGLRQPARLRQEGRLRAQARGGQRRRAGRRAAPRLPGHRRLPPPVGRAAPGPGDRADRHRRHGARRAARRRGDRAGARRTHPGHAGSLRGPVAQLSPGRVAGRQPDLGQPPLQGARGAPAHRRVTFVRRARADLPMGRARPWGTLFAVAVSPDRSHPSCPASPSTPSSSACSPWPRPSSPSSRAAGWGSCGCCWRACRPT
ncbi:hypothetical protein SGPA1_31013 [Streptomyces misionensis JCM 4497]